MPQATKFNEKVAMDLKIYAKEDEDLEKEEQDKEDGGEESDSEQEETED